MVALAYATRHPEHPAKLILVSTEAAGDTHLERRVALFERLGGPEVGALARRRFLDGHGHADAATLEAWMRLAFPLYTRTPRDPAVAAPRGPPSRSHALVHAAGRRGAHVQPVPGAVTRAVSDARAGRGRRSR